MDFSFYMPARVLYGEECILKNKERLAALGDRCLIVSGGTGASKSGALHDMTNVLDQLGVLWESYDGIGANPLLSACKEAGDKARAFGARFIVGIGGGSVLDGAKAAALYAANQIAPEEIYSLPEQCSCLPIVLAGTTAGTGSEVTNASVLTTDRTGVKKSISKDCLYATISLCDPRYTHSLSPYQTLSTALDALSHSLESAVNTEADSISSLFATEAFIKIFPILRRHGETMDSYTAEERDDLFSGSILAGYAINRTGTCFPHPLGYVVTEQAGIPHGLATAFFLPSFLQKAIQAAPHQLEPLCTAIGIKPQELTDILSGLVKPYRDAVRLSPAVIAGQAERLLIQKNYQRTPGGFTGEDAALLLTKLFSPEQA